MSYETLEMFLNGKEQPFLWIMLKKLPPEKRIDELTELLLESTATYLDDRSAFLWDALMHAVSDVLLAPIMREVEEFQRKVIQVRDVCGADPEATVVHNSNRRQRVGFSAHFIELIPSYEEKLEWSGQQRKNVPVKRLTLLQTKKLLWTEIADWWHDTADEQAALEMFDQLLTLELSFAEERDALTEIIRQKTDGMEAKRLLSCMLMVKCYRDNRFRLQKKGVDVFMRCRDSDAWLSLMLHAWIRRQKPLEIVALLEAVAPVAAYKESWRMLAQYSEPIGAFCLQVEALRDFINPPGKYNSIFDRCTASVRYEKLGEAIVELDSEKKFHGQDSSDAEYAALAKEKISGWLSGRSGIRIQVRIGFKSTIPGREFASRMEFWVN